MDEEVNWSELPTEIWSNVGKSLENRIDILRFRSVCVSWRSSIPPSLPNSPSFPWIIPHPVYHHTNTHLICGTIYLIEPIDGISNINLPPLAPSSSSKWWLIMVKESKYCPILLSSPINNREFSYPLGAPQMLWNLLGYRLIQLCKSYTILDPEKWLPNAENKVVVYPNSPWIGAENCMACCIFEEGTLGLMKHGDEKWTLVDDNIFYYDDVIVFKGQFYVTDKWGTISWIDVSSLKVIQFSPPLCCFGSKKHLVESCGSLYVVDRYYESGPNRREYIGLPLDQDAVVSGFAVYKFDEECRAWVDVNNLGDRAFILGDSCNLSVSAKDLTGYKRNCIYFTVTDLYSNIRTYNLGNHKFSRLFFDPCLDENFWKHPPWLKNYRM